MSQGLPPRFGNWHTVDTRMNRWSKKPVLDRVFVHLQREQIVRIKLEARYRWTALSSRSTPTARVALKKNGPQSIDKARGVLTAKIHMVASGCSNFQKAFTLFFG